LDQEATGQTLVNMMDLDVVIGSGGVLSHAPDRRQSALMMIDAYQPEGITLLTVDSIFMMPHLGVLSEHLPGIAAQVFERDCLIRIGTLVAPVGTGKEGEPCLTVSGGINETLTFGEIRLIPLGLGETVEVTLDPAKGFDVGAGKGKRLTVVLEGGVGGVFLDCRGRPLAIPNDAAARRQWVSRTLANIGLRAETAAV
jgi:hypothetical protein